MNFNSIEYLLFLPLVCLVYFLVIPKFRWIVLFTASCIFYMWLIPEYILCLFFLILIDFYTAQRIYSSKSENKRKLWLIISVISNFGLLFYFKYFDFFANNINPLIISLFGEPISLTHSILPIGLSFHTFQSISYIIDVYRKDQKPEKHIGIYSNYVLFFPQMVAGPIERFSNLGNELNKTRSFQFNFLKRSIALFIIGFFYKMVIADNCGSYVNDVFNSVGEFGRWDVLLAIVLFSIQIYADFFGYSLIAQASAGLFGISLIDNFKFPFFSINLVEFWKRWHISLTSWFRNYLYIPLGGSRNGKVKHTINILAVFLLSGLWHGASWGFVTWGGLHAVMYLIIINTKTVFRDYIPALFKYVSTFLLVSFIFVFFRGVYFTNSLEIFKALVNNGPTFNSTHLDIYLFVFILFVFALEFSAHKDENYTAYLNKLSTPIKSLILFSMLFLILIYSGIDQLSFIYFQF